MKKRQQVRIVTLVLVLGLVLSAGYGVYSTVDGGGGTDRFQLSLVEDQSIPPGLQAVEVSQEIQEILQAQYAEQYLHYLQKYQLFLLHFQVSPTGRASVEELLREGFLLGDILTGYDFLYQEYGTREELRQLLLKQQQDSTWEALLQDYFDRYVFIPRTFDSDYLEKLTETPGLTSDDIMLADQFSWKSGETFEGLIHRKQEGESWQQIADSLGIFNGAGVIPRVQVTQEKLNLYADGTFTEEQVVEGLVLAQKLGFTEAPVVALMKSGQTKAAILASGYREKYQ